MKSFKELIDEVELALSAEYGATGLSNIPENISDPLVQIVTLAIGGQAEIWKDYDRFINDFDISKVSCDKLMSIASIIGEALRTNKPTRHKVFISGVDDLVVPISTKFSDRNNIEWTTVEEITLFEGHGLVDVTSPVGLYEVPMMELELVDTILGIDYATNVSFVEGGYFTESCEQFRKRLMSADSSKADTDKGVIDALNDEAFSVKIINDAPDCISPNGNIGFVVRGGSDDKVGKIIANKAPMNFTKLAGNTEVSISDCESVLFIRPCPVGIKIQYWSENAVTDSEFIDAMCKDGIKGLLCNIPCISHFKFSTVHSRPESLGCLGEKSAIDCTGGVELIRDDCPCSASECDDGEYKECIVIESWEYPVFISANLEGVKCSD